MHFLANAAEQPESSALHDLATLFATAIYRWRSQRLAPAPTSDDSGPKTATCLELSPELRLSVSRG